MRKHNKYRDTGLLLLRMGFGIMFVLHGYPKLMQGSEQWAKLGEAINHFGITFGYTFWGFMSVMAEFGCGILLILGLFTKPVAAIMLINMIVALTVHIAKDHDIMPNGAHAAEDAIVFLSIVFMGAGNYSIDGWIRNRG
jgi:putative oxidoreductase